MSSMKKGRSVRRVFWPVSVPTADFLPRRGEVHATTPGGRGPCRGEGALRLSHAVHAALKQHMHIARTSHQKRSRVWAV